MKRFITSLTLMIALLGVGAVALPAPQAAAINVFSTCTPPPPADPKNPTTPDLSSSSVCAAKNDNATSMIHIVINLLLYALGIIAVIMIVIGGIRYTTSNGDSSGIKGAKDTITYAVVGLVVAMLAYAIVNFVVGKF